MPIAEGEYVLPALIGFLEAVRGAARRHVRWCPSCYLCSGQGDSVLERERTYVACRIGNAADWLTRAEVAMAVNEEVLCP